MAAHSKLGASSMYRWSQCPASVKLSENIPSSSSSYAEEGTLAHDYAAQILDEIFASKCFLSCIESIQNHYLNVHDQILEFTEKLGIDGEMLDAVMCYVDYVLELVSGMCPDKKSQILIEHRFDLSSVYEGCFGTADLVLYDAYEKHLYVVDYKHGQGIPVEAKDNPQLKYYGLGALMSLNLPCDSIELVVVQPRCHHPVGPIRTDKIDALEFIGFSADLVEFADKTKQENAEIKAGDWCRFCPASPTCPLLQEKALVAAQSDFSPNSLDNTRPIEELLEWLPIFETWIKNVRSYALNEAEKGRAPKGYKLVDKRPVRKWTNEQELLSYLLDLGMDRKELFEEKVLTPPKMEKAIGKENFKHLQEFIVKKSSGVTLVSEKDKRPEVIRNPSLDFEIVKEN